VILANANVYNVKIVQLVKLGVMLHVLVSVIISILSNVRIIISKVVNVIVFLLKMDVLKDNITIILNVNAYARLQKMDVLLIEYGIKKCVSV